jgi:hypothetical protein
VVAEAAGWSRVMARAAAAQMRSRTMRMVTSVVALSRCR